MRRLCLLAIFALFVSGCATCEAPTWAYVRADGQSGQIVGWCEVDNAGFWGDGPLVLTCHGAQYEPVAEIVVIEAHLISGSNAECW